jgi:hypothetical protein
MGQFRQIDRLPTLAGCDSRRERALPVVVRTLPAGQM